AERAFEQAEYEAVVLPALGLEVDDVELRSRAHADVAAVLHVEVHLAVRSRDDAFALVDRVALLGPPRLLPDVEEAHVALDQRHRAGDGALSVLRAGELGQQHQDGRERQTKHLPPSIFLCGPTGVLSAAFLTNR